MSLRSMGPRRTATDPDDAREAEDVAIRMLRGAAQSRRSLQRRLELHGFNPDAAEAAVDRCAAMGYLNDAELAASLAGRHARRGHGAARVVADLQQRGVPRDLIAAATASFGEDESAALTRIAAGLVERERRRHPLDDAAWRRVGAALQRRGFSAAAIRGVLRRLA